MSPISHQAEDTEMPAGGTLWYIAIPSLVGILVMLFATNWGIALGADSTAYLAAARSLLAGRGLSLPTGTGETVLMTHYAPLLSTLLAAIGVLGLDLLQGARWLYAGLFGANIALVGLMIHRFTDGAPWFPLLGSLLMLGSVAMLDVHAMLLSEPLFIITCLLGLWFLAEHLRSPKALLLVAACGASALAFLARYVGAALVVTGVVGILVLGKREVRKRVLDAGLLAAIGCTPIAVWIVRNARMAGSSTNRDLAFHPITLRRLGTMLATLAEWALPARVHALLWGYVYSLPKTVQAVQAAFLLSLGAVALALGGITFWRQRKLYVTEMYWMGLFLMFGLFYLAFLVASISLFDASTPLDSRVLSPLFAVGLILFLGLAERFLVLLRGRPSIRLALMVLLALLVGSYLVRSVGWAARSHSEGRAYTSRQWRQSELIERIRALPLATTVYSNGADAIYALTGRHAAYIPRQVDPTSARPNEDYAYELAEMRTRLENQGAVLVYFDAMTGRWYLPPESELREQLPLTVLATGDDGTIYTIK